METTMMQRIDAQITRTSEARRILETVEKFKNAEVNGVEITTTKGRVSLNKFSGDLNGFWEMMQAQATDSFLLECNKFDALLKASNMRISDLYDGNQR